MEMVEKLLIRVYALVGVFVNEFDIRVGRDSVIVRRLGRGGGCRRSAGVRRHGVPG